MVIVQRRNPSQINVLSKSNYLRRMLLRNM